MERDLAALPKSTHRMYLFGHKNIKSLSHEEITLVAAAHEPIMAGKNSMFFINMMLENPRGSRAYRYARVALVYQSISLCMYEQTPPMPDSGRRPQRDTVTAIYGGVTEDVDTLVTSMTETEDLNEQYRRLVEFGKKLMDARRSRKKPK